MIFAGILVGVAALIVGSQWMAGPKFPRLEAGPWLGSKRTRGGRVNHIDAHGRRFRVTLRRAMQDLYAQVDVPLVTPAEATRAGPVEGLGFKSVELLEDEDEDWWLVYSGSDRWRLLREPMAETNPAMDEGPKLVGDDRRVRVLVDEGHIGLGFGRVDGARLDGILAGMAELADVLESALLHEWTRLHDELGLAVQGTRAAGSTDGFLVNVGPERIIVRLRHPIYIEEVGHAEHIEGEAPDDPVLGMLLRGRGDLSLLTGDVVEPLLAVLHAFPGSRLLDDRIELKLPDSDQLVERVELGLALARALR
ncbi:MAG: hypothetical protein GY913_06045 [Proteobacteria bacterium]|nr:hypothetical protein [Pseudomonadota bacterium]MCP4916467.1 hypothetical protein [Pseudomonadota bacterium]